MAMIVIRIIEKYLTKLCTPEILALRHHHHKIGDWESQPHNSFSRYLQSCKPLST